MKSLKKFLEDALIATPLNTTGMGDCKGLETDPINTDTKQLRKKRLKKKS